MAASHGRESSVLQGTEDEICSGTSAQGPTRARQVPEGSAAAIEHEDHGKVSFGSVTGERKVPTGQRFLKDHGICQISSLPHGPSGGGPPRAPSMPMLDG